MGCLKSIIEKYFKENIESKEDNYLFGKLKEYSSSQEEGEDAIILEVNGNINGYLVVNQNKSYHEVSYSGEEESFIFRLFQDKVIIKVEEYQITSKEPIHPQAIYKEDWITPDPTVLLVKGDYTNHRNILEKYANQFKNGKLVELWLPNLFECYIG